MSNEIKLPELGEGVVEGEILKIKVAAGDTIHLDQPLLEVMTDKASMEIPSSREGVIKEVKAKPGDMVEVGQTIFVLESSSETSFSPSEKSNPSKLLSLQKEISAVPSDSASEPPICSDDILLAAPPTRKLAHELGLSLENIKGTGEKGRILRKDLIRYVKSAIASERPVGGKSPALPVFSKEDRREPLSGIKRVMFETMTSSHYKIPPFTVVEKACAKRIYQLRKELKDRLAPQGVKITYLSFIMKALVPCLREFPILNSSFDEETREIVYRKSLNMAFAVDTPQGLLVPVIHEVQSKSLLELAKAIEALAAKARRGELSREQLQNGTFTLTNMGSVGGISGAPIINPPQVAILGIYRMENQPILTKDGKLAEVPHMNFSLTCDHRFIDGATAGRFLKSLILRIEDPGLLVLEN